MVNEENVKMVKRWLQVNERTPAYLARKIGYEYTGVWNFLKGKPISPEFLIALREFTKVPLNINIKGYTLIKKAGVNENKTV